MSFIEKSCLKQLNLSEILELIKPCSEPGRKLKSGYKPFTPGKEKELIKEYRRVNSLMKRESNEKFFSDLKSHLRRIENIKGTIVRVNDNQALELNEIFEIKKYLYYYEKIRLLLETQGVGKVVELYDFSELLDYLDIDGQNSPVFSLSNRYSETLRELRVKISELINQLSLIEKQKLDQTNNELVLKVIEKQIVVSRHQKQLVRDLEDSQLYTLSDENYVNLTYTLRKNAEEIKIEEEIEQLRIEIGFAGRSVREKICGRIKDVGTQLTKSINEIAKLDLLLAKALFGLEIGGIIPELINTNFEIVTRNDQNILEMEESINLYVQRELANEKITYQPISISFDKRANVITGTNMGGKSTLLKTIGQLFYLTAFAIPLPCKSAQLPLVDFIFFSSDFESSKRTDLSSFASELIAINEALKKPGLGLFLIDEFARGTNPQEGEAFARTVVESFISKEALLFSATHFSTPSLVKEAGHYRIAGLSEECYEKLKAALVSGESNAAKNLNERIQELHHCMDYSLKRVEGSNEVPRAATMVAEILGIDEEIITKVKEFTNNHS